MHPDYYATLAQKEYKNGFQDINYCNTAAVTARYHMLVATGHKEDKETGGNALRQEWAKQRLQVELAPLPDFLQPPSINLVLLPFGSFSIRFEFKLLKPYISRDDNPFYIIDNPIVRDKVFRYPLVPPTAWKGALRHAFWQLGYQGDDQQIQRLFGAANDDQPDEGNAGRLYFYPAFFTQTRLEIVNPHDRKRRVGKNPILFESVPAGAKGAFSLLYVPFDCIGKDEAETRQQVFADLQRVAEGLQAMFLTYGFGAKTSSGFGLAMEELEDGFFQIRFEESGAPPVPPLLPTHEASLPKYLQAPGRLKDEYLNPDGAFHERSQAELEKMTKSQRQEYEKAKKWWEREGKALTEQPAVEPEPPESQPASQQWLKREFGSFEELVRCAEEVAALFQAGGEE